MTTVVIVATLAASAMAADPALSARWSSRELPLTRVFDDPAHLLREASLFGVSCPSRSFCVAGGTLGFIASSHDPTGGGGDWKIVRPVEDVPFEDHPERGDPTPPFPGAPAPDPPPAVDGRTIKSVSCPSTSFCVAVSYDGFVLSSSDPGGDAGAWKTVDVDGDGRDTHLESVSCPTTNLCVAVSGNRYTSGRILTSTNPGGGKSAWHEAQLGEEFDLRAVSCASTSLCVAVGQGGRVLRSTNPDGGAGAWRDLGTPGGPGNLQALACPAGLCAAGNAGGNVLSSASPGAEHPVWKEVNAGGSVQVTGISCPSNSTCAGVDNNGGVFTSIDPTGPGSSWSYENLVPYVPPETHAPVLNALFNVSCPSPSFCALVGAKNTIFTSTDPFARPAKAVKKQKRIRKRPRTTLARVDRFHNLIPGSRFKARFRFYADAPVRRFLCKHDSGPWRACKSPHRYWTGVGRHVIRVRAVGLTGLKGRIALDRFQVIHRKF